MKKFKVWFNGFGAFMSLGTTILLYLSFLWIIPTILLGDSLRNNLYILWTSIVAIILASVFYAFLFLKTEKTDGAEEFMSATRIIRGAAKTYNPILFVIRKIKR